MIAEPAGEGSFQLSTHGEHVVNERGIQLEWIALALSSPDLTEPDQSDPELTHALRTIAEREGRILRVVYNSGHEPPLIVTAFFDRSMRGKL